MTRLRPSAAPLRAGRLLAVSATVGSAQLPVPAPAGAVPRGPATVRVAAIADVPPGAQVRVVLVDGRRASGRFQGVAADTLRLRVGQGAFVTPVVAVDTLWARTGRGTARGVAIGAGVGGAALAGFALFLTQALCESASCNVGRDGWTAIGVGGAVGAFGGAVVGAGVGSLVRTWRRVAP